MSIPAESPMICVQSITCFSKFSAMQVQYRIIVFMKNLLLVAALFLAVSCNRKWTEKDKSEFMSGCLSGAMRDPDIGDSLAREYCRCLLDTVVKEYPNANDAKYIKYDSAIINMSKGCLEKAKKLLQ